MKEKRTIKLTITRAAVEFAVSPATIKKGLRRNDIPADQKDYTLAELHRALGGDFKFERTRRERAEADLAEMKARREALDSVPRADVTRFINAVFGPLREQLLSLPSGMASQCNPNDPGTARLALHGWADGVLRGCKQNMPKELEG